VICDLNSDRPIYVPKAALLRRFPAADPNSCGHAVRRADASQTSPCPPLIQRWRVGDSLLTEAAVRADCLHAAGSRCRRTHLGSFDVAIREPRPIRVRVASVRKLVRDADRLQYRPIEGCAMPRLVVPVEVDAIADPVAPLHLASTRAVCCSLNADSRVRVDGQSAVACVGITTQRRHTVCTGQAAIAVDHPRLSASRAVSQPVARCWGVHAHGPLGTVPCGLERPRDTRREQSIQQAHPLEATGRPLLQAAFRSTHQRPDCRSRRLEVRQRFRDPVVQDVVS
jgi:hypothetical protein